MLLLLLLSFPPAGETIAASGRLHRRDEASIAEVAGIDPDDAAIEALDHRVRKFQ